MLCNICARLGENFACLCVDNAFDMDQRKMFDKLTWTDIEDPKFQERLIET